MADPVIQVFGIRHHGPGSARSLVASLETLSPDVVLIEGPPDAAAVLPLLARAEMEPPVALLLYRPEEPRHAVYYPFAVFSPEWQALQWASRRQVPARFMDLPVAHQLALAEAAMREALEADGGERPAGQEGPEGPEGPGAPAGTLAAPEGSPDPGRADPGQADTGVEPDPAGSVRRDPLGWLARAAGFNDGERWWEHVVEHRRDGADVFAAVMEAMTALREAADGETEAGPAAAEARLEALREAWMRQSIRAARKEGFVRIAVVCGAWHAPALAVMPREREDSRLLKGLPRVKVEATWVPWTYDRLAFEGGYGAGIHSPGWYHHLWSAPDRVATRWMTRVARLLREEDLDCSPAHVIEAVRLAESLAALRGRPLPGLPELNEAALAVVCHGNDAPMRLIQRRLVVGERLGRVPEETPMVPLQQDLAREQRRLRLPVEAAHRDLDLDLRKPTDLDRSVLLHRLCLLDIPWGEPISSRRGTGTFREEWRIQWRPELAVHVIEAGTWGNTLRDAATARARDSAAGAPDLPTLTGLAGRVLLADLPDAVSAVMDRLQASAAVTTDVAQLMDAVPPLAEVVRYGNVRGTDRGLVGHVADGLVVRTCVGLPGACSSLNDEAAESMFGRIQTVHGAIKLLEDPDHTSAWRDALLRLADREGVHGLVAGRAVRLLLDDGAIPAEDAARRLGLALSTAVEAAQAAAWVEGLLKGSGLLLLHDEALWDVLDAWVTGLSGETFTSLLPLLRRTFATFPAPERRQMGERAARGPGRGSAAGDPTPGLLDTERADAVLPLLGRILGLSPSGA